MEAGKNYFNAFLMVVVGVFGVTCLIIAVSFSVRATTAPMLVAMREVLSLQKTLDSKMTDGVVAENAALASRVTALEGEVRLFRQAILGPDGGAKLRQMMGKPDSFNQPPAEDLKKVYDLPIDGSYVMGKPYAKVTIVEFSDFQCPFCARFHPALMDLAKAFPDDVRVVFKNFPLPMHPHARGAAKAALAAGLQGKYFEMAGLIMQNMQNLSEEKYKELAATLGLDVAKFSLDLKEQDGAFEKKIDADMALAKKSDVRGTPTYFINGKKSQARDLEGWKAEVKAILGN